MPAPDPSRFVCVHGHFYQPPRENPWLNVIEREPSAHPDHDWNSRIARECYIPNSAARIVNDRGGIIDIVNNYSHLSFDFGPTLLTWFEREHPAEYRRIIEADRESCRRLDGHGNAIAHAYSHMILPLADERDLNTQIRWGLADFRHRFGREPEALWLPETAVNETVLRALIDHGMKFVILSPHQAQRVRPIGRKEWRDVASGSVDPRVPYRWYDRSSPGDPGQPSDAAPEAGTGTEAAAAGMEQGELPQDPPSRFIDVFFYDGGLAHAFSFERLLTHSRAAADRLEAATGSAQAPVLVHAATDGETFGHHHHHAEMGLAHLFTHELPARCMAAVSYGWYLSRHEPAWEVELRAGDQEMGTSWSCSHGVGRWMEDCGCGAAKGHGRWRKPLRDALDFLRDALTALFEEHGGRVLKDVWAARDDFISVMLDRSPESVARFMRAHAKVEPTAEVRDTVLRLMEMQKDCLFMYTSCGWFFNDISGLEAVQNLRYAARALELAARVSGTDLEGDFLQRLRLAPANHRDHGADGAAIYRNLVKRSVVSHDHLAARYALARLFEDAPETLNYHYRVREGDVARHDAGGARFLAGKVVFESGITHKSWERAFLAAALPDQTVRAYVSGDGFSEAGYRALLEGLPAAAGAEALEGLAASGLFPGRPFGLEDLLPDERAHVLSLILERKLSELREKHDAVLAEYLPLAERFVALGLPVPPVIKAELELALCQWVGRRVRALCRPGAEAVLSGGALAGLDEIEAMARRASKAGLQSSSREAEAAWSSLVCAAVDHLERGFGPEALASFARLLKAGSAAGFKDWRLPVSAQFFGLLQRNDFGRGSGVEPDALLAAAGLLDIDARTLRERLAAGRPEAQAAAEGTPSTP
ncbi:MAG: DUF3536 domain-containing protein [Elusimicrobiota bacterium]|jgi:alpha-amylase/alpha-mannosidase (GH57 family)